MKRLPDMSLVGFKKVWVVVPIYAWAGVESLFCAFEALPPVAAVVPFWSSARFQSPRESTALYMPCKWSNGVPAGLVQSGFS